MTIADFPELGDIGPWSGYLEPLSLVSFGPLEHLAKASSHMYWQIGGAVGFGTDRPELPHHSRSWSLG